MEMRNKQVAIRWPTSQGLHSRFSEKYGTLLKNLVRDLSSCEFGPSRLTPGTEDGAAQNGWGKTRELKRSSDR
jgi:hypothetical protein